MALAPPCRSLELPTRGGERYVELTVKVTAYTAGPESTGKRPGQPGYGVTASGKRVSPGAVAADPSVPFGTRVWIPGYGPGVVVDRGAAVRGPHLDVFFEDVDDALDWGVRYLPVRFYGSVPGVLQILAGGPSETSWKGGG